MIMNLQYRMFVFVFLFLISSSIFALPYASLYVDNQTKDQAFTVEQITFSSREQEVIQVLGVHLPVTIQPGQSKPTLIQADGPEGAALSLDYSTTATLVMQGYWGNDTKNKVTTQQVRF